MTELCYENALRNFGRRYGTNTSVRVNCGIGLLGESYGRELPSIVSAARNLDNGSNFSWRCFRDRNLFWFALGAQPMVPFVLTLGAPTEGDAQVSTAVAKLLVSPWLVAA